MEAFQLNAEHVRASTAKSDSSFVAILSGPGFNQGLQVGCSTCIRKFQCDGHGGGVTVLSFHTAEDVNKALFPVEHSARGVAVDPIQCTLHKLCSIMFSYVLFAAPDGHKVGENWVIHQVDGITMCDSGCNVMEKVPPVPNQKVASAQTGP